jgi:plasmid maintenance system killer protein
MQVRYSNKKLEKLASDGKERQRKLGTDGARRFEARISEFKAAGCLEDLRNLPQARIHELKGDRKNQFSADLCHPYRLIFTAANDPEPRKATDGGWDWKGITIIAIQEIANTHE